MVFIFGLTLPISVKAASIQNYVFLILAYLLMIILSVASWLFGLWGKAFNMVFEASQLITQYNVISVGWSLTRDVLNMFFVIALLIIAFATILRIESYQYKVLLPKLIYAALLVNFSRTIATTLVEFSNVLMKTLLNLSSGSIAETFAMVIFGGGTGTIAKPPTFGSSSEWQVVTTIIAGYVITIFLVLAMSIAIAGLTLMMIVRSLMLMILIILSPVAFVLNILPVTAQYAKRWWDEFLKYVFYGPIAAFCVYLAVMLAIEVRNKITHGKSGLNLTQNADQVLGLMQADAFFSILLVIAFLGMSIMVVKALSPMAAGMAMGLYKRGGRLAGKAAGWGVKSFGRGLSRSAASGSGGLVGKTLGAIPGLAGGIAGLATGKGFGAGYRSVSKAVGDYAAFASPEVVKRTLAAQRQQQDEKTFGKGAAFVRTKTNKWFRNQDQTDYVKQQYRKDVAEQGKFLDERNPSKNPALLLSELKGTVGKKGQEAKQEAIIRSLAATGSLNDLVNDPELSKMLHSKEFLESRKKEEYYNPATGEKIDKTKNPEEWQMAHDSAEGYTYHTAQDIFKNMFGEQHGVQLMADVNSSLRNNGDYTLDGSIKITPDGKTRLASHSEQAEGMAASLSKLSADKFDSLSRHSFAAESLNKSGKVNDKLKLQNGMKVFMQKHGPSADSVARIDRQMSLKTQEVLIKAQDDIAQIAIEQDNKGNRHIAQNLQNQVNAAAKNLGKGGIKIITEKETAASTGSRANDYKAPLSGSPFQRTDDKQ